MFAVPEGQLAERLRTEGAAVATGRFNVDDGARTAVTALRSLVKRLRPSAVHSRLAFADLVAQLAVVGLSGPDGRRIRLVSTEHGIAQDPTLYQAHKAVAGLKMQVHALRLHRTDHVIAVSESTREQVLAQWDKGASVTVIRNGVDRRDDVTRPHPGLRVLSLARLSHEKRIDALIRAFARVKAEQPSATLTIAGEGPLRAALEEQVRAQGLDAAVELPGFVESDAALREHDVVAQLSVWENLSYTLLDAVAYGLGVVATPVGGNPEIVPNRCLVAAGDADAIARAIVEQGTDPSARPQLPESIPTVAAMCSRISDLYGEVFA